MAGGLANMNRMINRLLGITAAATMSAYAQTPADPTRPPAGFESAPAGSAVPAQPAPAKAGLQTIIRRANGKPAAVINGRVVELGGRIGDARLVNVNEDSVVLQTPAGRETLRLTPGIEKQPANTQRRGRKEAKP
jgi:MSHA biogenesis protein MshK